MSIDSDRKIITLFLAIVIAVGSVGIMIYESEGGYNDKVLAAGLNPTDMPLSAVQTGPMNAFPGQLINESYYLGATSPSASYYEVTVTLNGSSYVTLDAFPTYTSSIAPSGYYLLFSFQMPNDQPGMWWIVGYEIIPFTVSNIEEEQVTTVTTQGAQIWMQYPTVSTGGNYMVTGRANFTFTNNVTKLQIYPSNPQGSIIVSSQVNSWEYITGILRVDFSLYENIGNSNGPTTPPQMTASLVYSEAAELVCGGNPVDVTGYSVNLVQGNGAYISGVTSSQIAEITNSINQTLSIPITQLNAAVTSINGDVANLQTSFGTMTAELSTIDATLSSITGGVAYLNTSLGEVKTSLSSLDSTVLAVEGNTVTLQTSLGNINTGINELNTTVTSVKSGQATIQTDIGLLQISLNNLNATLLNIQNGIATIESSVGLIETSLSSINATLISVRGNTVTLATSLGAINTTLKEIGASLVSINNGEATVLTNLGSMTVSIGKLNATIVSISKGQATVLTDVGSLETSLASLGTTISSISAGEVEISTDIGKVATSIDSLNASFRGMNGSNAVIQTEIGLLETSLSSINATISSVRQGLVDMNTSIGTIQVSLSSLNSSIVSLSGYTAEIMTSAGEISASLNDLNTSIFSSSSGLPWVNDSYAKIETCLGNLTGTITNVSNNTASIKTNLGVVTASMSAIKSLKGQGAAADPPTVYDLIIIAMLGALLIVASLAMFSSRNTLKIMGDKVK